jgi:hypothetical protein
MLLTYLNLTPDESIVTNTPAIATEEKGITDSVNSAIEKKTRFLPEKEKRKFASANYDEINLPDFFGALDY